MVKSLREEQTIPEAVNALVQELRDLNGAFISMAAAVGLPEPEKPWDGSLDSLAARQLKWVYWSNADDDEFLKRATLLSTFVIDGLDSTSLRRLLNTMGGNLHLNEGNPPSPLGSRNLLQRVALVAVLLENFRVDVVAVPTLVLQAEGKMAVAGDVDLGAEFVQSRQRVRESFAPLAFLYELRVHSGIAHTPNTARVGKVAGQLGLTKEGWHRADYLRLLNLVTESVLKIAHDLEVAARFLHR